MGRKDNSNASDEYTSLSVLADVKEQNIRLVLAEKAKKSCINFAFSRRIQRKGIFLQLSREEAVRYAPNSPVKVYFEVTFSIECVKLSILFKIGKMLDLI